MSQIGKASRPFTTDYAPSFQKKIQQAGRQLQNNTKQMSSSSQPLSTIGSPGSKSSNPSYQSKQEGIFSNAITLRLENRIDSQMKKQLNSIRKRSNQILELQRQRNAKQHVLAINKEEQQRLRKEKRHAVSETRKQRKWNIAQAQHKLLSERQNEASRMKFEYSVARAALNASATLYDDRSQTTEPPEPTVKPFHKKIALFDRIKMTYGVPQPKKVSAHRGRSMSPYFYY